MKTTWRRFRAKVEVDGNGCWRWIGRREPNGYGRFRYMGRTTWAHRAAYEMIVGPIPVGMDIDHLCRVRDCVNPADMELVDRRENARRGIGGVNMRLRTHCPQGHEYTPDNTHMSGPRRNRRNCRTCWRTRGRIAA